MDMTRRRWIWWIFIPIPTVIVAGVGILFGSAWLKAGRTLHQQRLVVPARTAALKAERVIRPIVFEPAEVGNGWDLLTPALAAIGALTDEDLVGFPSYGLEEINPPDPERIETVLARIRPHIEGLKQALRRPSVEPDTNYDNLLDQKYPWMAHALKTSKILRDSAGHRHAGGRSAEAVEFVLIMMGIADRVAVKGFLIHELVATVIRSLGHESLRNVLASHDLSTAELHRLSRVLGELDPRPETDTQWLAREDLYFRQVVLNLVDRPERGGVNVGTVPSARHYFSLRIMIAECLGEQDRYMTRVNAVTALPLGERSAAARRLTSDFERASIMHALMVPQLGRAWYNLASSAMTHRLARLSVALALYHAETGEYPPTLEALVPKYIPSLPVDAFAGLPIAYTRADGGARVASQARDPEFTEGTDATGELFNSDGFHEWRVRRR